MGRCFTLLGLAAAAAAADSRKEVTSLPGWGAPPTKHWSGFVEVDAATDSHLYYYLAEAEGDAASKPLVWWYQGGPGASSMVGMFSELGPLVLNASVGLMANPYAWTKEANLLVVEFAEGIGFSYCENSTRTDLPCKQSSGMCSPCLSTDDQVAERNAIFLEKFLVLFPEYKNRQLYLAGESYAGVYVPTAVQQIMKRGKAQIDLRGLWVTDPCTDNKAQAGFLDFGVEFVFQMGMINAHYRDILIGPGSKCFNGRRAAGDYVRVTDTAECRRAWRVYDVATAGIGDAVHPKPINGLPLYFDPLNAIGKTGDPNLEAYLNRPDVRTAINAQASKNKVYHLSLDNNGYDGYTAQYDACNDFPTRSESMVDVYRSIVSMAKGTSFGTIMISSGDVDPVVAMPGTEAAVMKTFGSVLANGTEAFACERRPWFYDSRSTPLDTLRDKPLQWGRALTHAAGGTQMGGFTSTVTSGSDSVHAHFITFRDSGHMVPLYAPQKALHVLRHALLAAPSTTPLSPCLPVGWSTDEDTKFYGTDNVTGEFVAWYKQATSPEFTE